MNGLEIAAAEGALAGYLLTAARVSGFVLLAPPFNARAVPGRARAGLILTLSLPLSVWLTPRAPSLASTELVLGIVLQMVTGAALGLTVLIAVAVMQVIGDIIDLVGGFSMSIAMDPLTMVQSSVMGRLHYMLGVVLLFGTESHLVIIQGLARSLELMPTPVLDTAELSRALVHDTASMIFIAVQIAGPIVAVMFIADIVLGLMTRVAPALNAFSLGFPLKIMITLLLAGFVLVRLPEVITRTITQAGITILRISGGG